MEQFSSGWIVYADEALVVIGDHFVKAVFIYTLQQKHVFDGVHMRIFLLLIFC